MDTTVADPMIGELLDGRYRIVGQVASGGMATVYQATDERLEREVAIKVIHPTYAGNAHFVSRFVREAKTIAGLSHPNVVSVYDSGQHRNLPYLVMEYVRGQTLRELLATRGRLGAAEALAIMEPTLAALAAAHRAGLVHRDVKPENILIGEPDRATPGPPVPVVKVADFGLAHAVESSADDATGGQLMATVAYVPPELIQYGQADPRSDVYSAGIVLFEMLTGDIPYHGKQSVDVAYQHVEKDVPPPSRFAPETPAPLDELVVRATRRDPGGRPTDAGAFLAELRATREDIGLAAAGLPAPPVPRFGQPGQSSQPGQPGQFGQPGHPARPGPGGTVGSASVAEFSQTRLVPIPTQRPPAQPPTRTTGRSRKIALIAASVVVLLGLIAGIGGWYLGSGQYTSAPSLLDGTRTTAQSTAQKRGFKIRWGQAQFSESKPKDAVLAQDPPPGGRIAKGGTITVTLSRGPERYTVPDLSGYDADKARSKLTDMHLKVTTSQDYSSTVASGKVITQTPKPSTVVRRGDTVQLTISKGPAPITVPNVVGMSAADAQDKLSNLGLKVSASHQESQTVAKGTVIKQDPGPNTGTTRGSTVSIVISDGPPLFPVPAVTGLSLQEAAQKIKDAGFQVQAFSYSGRAGGTVIAQSPDGNSKAAKGTMVTLYVY